MLMRRWPVVAVIVAVMSVLTPVTPSAAVAPLATSVRQLSSPIVDDPGTWDFGVKVSLPGSPTPPVTSPEDVTPTPAGPPQEGDCVNTSLGQFFPPGHASWAGHSDADGDVYSRTCLLLTTGTEPAWRYVGVQYIQDGVPPPPFVMPDPETIVAEVYSRGRLPSPAVHLGPKPEQIAVKVPVWMWIEDPALQPTTETDPLGLISITVTPRVVSTTWEPGEPSPDENPDLVRWYSTADPITCQGLGEAPPPDVNRHDEGPCSYTYRWRATAERTDDRCTWPLTVTVNWAIDWTASTGETGSIPLTTSTSTPVMVGEWRTVLVADPLSPEPNLVNPRCRIP